ncbi:hypothetical protein U9R90_06480 [Streptomyces sp. E11-3]|uniref:hypothetical protein n=1 Tax=Streptomyces sp. E11-3 TaxID=3110112 RepID=UPI003980DF7F
MRRAVGQAKGAGIDARFAGPIPEFEGKGVCGDPGTIHGFVTKLTDSDRPAKDFHISAQSFHPKIAGARLYANVLDDTLKNWGL